MVLEFHKLEYRGKLDFAKFKYLKSSKSLHIFEIMVDCNIVCLCFLAIFAKFNSQQNYNTVNFGFKKKKTYC